MGKFDHPEGIASTMATDVGGDDSEDYKRGYQDAIRRTHELVRAFQEMEAVKAKPDPHVAWLEEWKVARATWCKAASGHEEDWDKPVVNAMEAEEARLSALIGQTVAKTREGMIAQLDYWIADWGDCHSEEDPSGAVIYSVRQTLAEGQVA